MTAVTEEILEELKWKLVGNKWIHEKGMFIYADKMPKTLSELVGIMTGTAYRKGQKNCEDETTRH